MPHSPMDCCHPTPLSVASWPSAPPLPPCADPCCMSAAPAQVLRPGGRGGPHRRPRHPHPPAARTAPPNRPRLAGGPPRATSIWSHLRTWLPVTGQPAPHRSPASSSAGSCRCCYSCAAADALCAGGCGRSRRCSPRASAPTSRTAARAPRRRRSWRLRARPTRTPSSAACPTATTRRCGGEGEGPGAGHSLAGRPTAVDL